jgi:hypothetical protein
MKKIHFLPQALLWGLLLVPFLLVLSLPTVSKADAGKGLASVKLTPSPTPKISVSADDEVVIAEPTPVKGAKKTFTWFFKNGCNCAQCRAFREKQLEEQERLKNNFQP